MHNIAVTVHNETVEESQAATELDIFKDEYDPVAPAMYLVAECGQLCTGTTCQTPFNADLVAKLLGNLLMTVMFIANIVGIALEQHLPAALAARGVTPEAS